MYVEGKTLTGWSDGNDTYAPGAAYTVPAADITLQPVFTANTVALGDRTEEVTVTFPLDGNNGHQKYNQNDGFIVTQVTIGTATIDVKADITGTIQTNNNGWHQVKNNFAITVPSAKGATVAINTYGDPTGKITFGDGASATTTGGSGNYTITSTILDAAETLVIKQDGAEYWRNIVITLPVVQSSAKTYTNEAAKVVWAFSDPSDISKNEATPEGVFSTIATNIGNLSIGKADGTNKTGTSKTLSGVTFVQLWNLSGAATDKIEWSVKPAAGLTFTPTKLSAYIVRFGTNVANGVTITAKKADGTEINLGNFTALRNSETYETDNKKDEPNITNKFEIELTPAQQEALSSTEGFFMYGTIGVGSGKSAGYADVTIEGLINGTAADVAKYTLDIAASPAEGGSVTKYPNSDEYEEGSTIKVTATENFGYDFVNWTNEAGTEVSTEPVYQFDITQNEKLTANFKAVNTYELKLTVDGTNDYMVTVSPAGTEVEGKQMYEEGTAVQLTANQYEGLVTFTNWSDGTTDASKLITMNDNVTLTANYSETDIIAGWDFYTAGNNGRKADFAAADNEADALSLVKTDDGTTSGWLDKSTLAAGGYEGLKGAAVNWRTGSSNGDVGHYHWQTKVNAEAFTNIKVQFQMVFNFNAYTIYDVEYSTDGTTWTKVGSTSTMARRQIENFSVTLPEACNNQKDLYIRMIADKNSTVDNGAPSPNDGNALGMFFITGTPKLVDDPVAPALLSSVPENGATGASATGKIVLNFDKKVQVVEGTKATLGSMELTPAVSGKVITFSYKGLEYATEYTFTLPANTVKNLTGATLTDAITINFTTMVRPSVTKALYDQVVSTTDELVAALQAAQSRADKNVRYRIFLKKGTYTLPQGTADKTYTVELKNGTKTTFTKKDPITCFNAQNVSIIGEDRDATIITNTIPAEDTFEGKYGTASIYEGIGNSDVFQLSGSDSYWQDLTVSTGMEDARGRDIAIEDKGTRTIWKNTKLHGYQDTWVGQNDYGLFYFEDGIIRGRTDYICGKGDAYYNRVEFQQIAGGYCAVPSRPASVGWVMKDCVINGDGEGVDGNYTLGRPWGSGTPVALWIDTRMNVVPSAIGWNEMSGGYPKRFAEYNSTTKTGSVIDLSTRKNTFDAYDERKEVIVDGQKTYEYTNRRNETNNPELTPAEAAEYSDMSKMFGEWEPTLLTEQAPIPQNVRQNAKVLEWDNSDYALLWAVVKDGSIIDFTITNSYEMTEDGTYSVRAANEMGGLSEASAEVAATGVVNGIQTVKSDSEAPVMTGDIYTLQGIRVDKARKGLYIIGGRKVVIK
ncbi:MAG: Ig-like domain-containing protein [Prevotella sp.]|nr:Ig-like domain-containing protein [Prevotella sp.]